jgi:hypothetical protein
LCKRCKQARAFIKSSKVRNAIAKAAKMTVATCVLCGAILGSSAPLAPTQAQASVRADYIEYAATWEWTPPSQAFLTALGSLPGDRGDSEPPHPAEVDLTYSGSAATHAGTASPNQDIDGLPQLSTLPYTGGAVPTSSVTGSVSRNWELLIADQGPVAGLGLPEHAQLEQLTPVIHLPARYQAALDKATSTNPGSGPRDRSHYPGRLRSGW